MKIDITKIEGYEEMTPEEKVAALEAIEYEVPDLTGYISKKRFDEVASEAAEWKRKLRALLSEEEQKKAAHDEELEALRQTVTEMEKEKTVSEIKSNYVSMGYDDELAEDTAKATVEGDNKRIFQNHRKFLESHDKAFEAALLSKTPRPGEGITGAAQRKSKAEIMAIKDPEERKKEIAENLDLFETERS